MLIDVHAHLNDPKLLPYREEIVSNMERDNLADIVTVGYDRPSSIDAYEFALKNEKVYSVVGIHPHDADRATKEDYDLFAKMSESEKTVAIGEIGLDYYYDLSPRETQRRVFVEQLELAYSLKMPVVIHLRDAYGDLTRILKENARTLYYGVLIHCYSGSKELVKELNKYDAYYSFGGAITFKNATEKPAVVRSVPIERLLTETDCPYMTPVPYRGTTNEPKYVDLVAAKLSEILDLPKEKIEEITLNNAKRIFKKIK